MSNLIRLSLTTALLIGISAPSAFAGMCEGTVHGLSRHYNPATGAGFLAVRAGPKASASQIGELFNGDRVEIFDRKGGWYRLASESDSSIDGWASVKWVRANCGW
ncbi:SH3 domain-containing protein [Aestuariivirga litoralis]|uniref:SH3 domain-containing protein n=1 Tax=Aestuariivirga litoralis TaxID=2650924 RepID=UPI0018C4BB65|nr:SH3 domain-containing protein [Aestuariivirga litoralis]MBG1231689.1 SH3 domain-containing protein [Aestuariivirga litoralis]